MEVLLVTVRDKLYEFGTLALALGDEDNLLLRSRSLAGVVFEGERHVVRMFLRMRGR